MKDHSNNAHPITKNNPPIGVTGPRNFIFFPLDALSVKPYILNEKRKVPIIKQ